MAEELGKIEKAEAVRFRGKRKIYVVSLLFASPDAPGEYMGILRRYWAQVKEHLARLEATAGTARLIYHESVPQAGEEGLKFLEKLNPGSWQIAAEKCAGGATLEALDEKELAEEIMDWERFILSGFVSRKVAEIVSGHYRECATRRYEQMSRRIEETLGEAEAGILFIREGHALQFATGIEVFSVSPPALDELHRWFRDQASKQDSGVH